MYNKILLPVDGSKNSEKAIKHATTLAIDEEAEIVILYVVDHRSLTSLPENALEDKELADYEKQGEVVTQRVVDQINGIIKETSPDKTIKTEKLIVEGKPANIIIKAIEKKDIDVVVIANSGKNFVDRFLIGSVTERIIRCSTVPIVVIPTKSE